MLVVTHLMRSENIKALNYRFKSDRRLKNVACLLTFVRLVASGRRPIGDRRGKFDVIVNFCDLFTAQNTMKRNKLAADGGSAHPRGHRYS